MGYQRKFKIGDKVRVVQNPKQHDAIPGQEFVITHFVLGESVGGESSYVGGIRERDLEMVEAPGAQFQVGDVVRLNKEGRELFRVDSFVNSDMVVKAVRDTGYNDRKLGRFYYVTDEWNPGVYGVFLETAKAAKSSDKNLKVGDRVEAVSNMAKRESGGSVGAVRRFVPGGVAVKWDGGGEYTYLRSSVSKVEAPQYQFQVGDIVQNQSSNREHVITRIRDSYRDGRPQRYAITDKNFLGMWFQDIKLVRTAADEAAAQREKAFSEIGVGDTVKATKGSRVIIDEVQEVPNVWKVSGEQGANLTLGAFNLVTASRLSTLRGQGYALEVIQKAPAPVEPEKALPDVPGLYVSQNLVIFALGDDGRWHEARGNGKSYLPGIVKEDTLRDEKHFPLLPLHKSSTPSAK